MINRCETCGGSWYQDQPEKHLMTCRPTPTEMEERVTDALFDAMDGRLEFHDARRLARAAISAMYKPTTEMLREVAMGAPCSTEDIAFIWENMIDAASPSDE